MIPYTSTISAVTVLWVLNKPEARITCPVPLRAQPVSALPDSCRSHSGILGVLAVDDGQWGMQSWKLGVVAFGVNSTQRPNLIEFDVSLGVRKYERLSEKKC